MSPWWSGFDFLILTALLLFKAQLLEGLKYQIFIKFTLRGHKIQCTLIWLQSLHARRTVNRMFLLVLAQCSLFALFRTNLFLALLSTCRDLWISNIAAVGGIGIFDGHVGDGWHTHPALISWLSLLWVTLSVHITVLRTHNCIPVTTSNLSNNWLNFVLILGLIFLFLVFV